MKKFFTLFSLLIFLGMSANVMAQNSGTAINPAIGDAFKYRVTSHDGSEYEWYVSDSPNIDGTPVAVVSIADATTNEAEITWVSPTVGMVYYVHVTETASESNGGCMNHKVMAVVPQNAFKLDFVNTNSEGVDENVGEVYAVCPPDVANSISYTGDADANSPASTIAQATSFTYNYGTTYLYYHITASGIDASTTGYTVKITPTIPDALANDRSATVSADFGTMTGSTFSPADGGNIPSVVTGEEFSYSQPAGSADIYLRLAIENGEEYEGTTEADIVLSLTGNDEFLNTVTSVNGSGTATDTESTKVKSRPDTGDITTD